MDKIIDTILVMYPIAIIGGGPVGLVSSILLSIQNVPNILFELHSGTSIHLKAIGINPQSIKVFRRIGLDDENLSAPSASK